MKGRRARGGRRHKGINTVTRMSVCAERESTQLLLSIGLLFEKWGFKVGGKRFPLFPR